MKGTIKKITLASMGPISFVMTTIALAALPYPRGWYIDGNVGESNVNNTSFGAGTSTTTKNSGFGLNVNGGYKFLPYFALEVGYTRFSTFDITFNNATIAKEEPYDYDITTKIILPIQDSGFNLYSKVGVARISSKIVINDSATISANNLDIVSGYSYKTGLLYGVGGEYFFSPRFGVHVSWIEVTGSSQTGNLALASVGFTGLFG